VSPWIERLFKSCEPALPRINDQLRLLPSIAGIKVDFVKKRDWAMGRKIESFKEGQFNF
jgi:hypothetical protein